MIRMCSFTRLTALLLAISAAAFRGYPSEPAERGPQRTSAQWAAADFAPAGSPASSTSAVVREKAPDSPGPPRKCNSHRHHKRTDGHWTGLASPTVRLAFRPHSDGVQCAVLWAQSVASSLQLQCVLLQI